jgi:hypothetical protein
MPCLRVIGGVHAYGLRIMVDGDVHAAAYGLLDATARAAAAREQVNHQLGVQRQFELWTQHGSVSLKGLVNMALSILPMAWPAVSRLASET